MRNNEMVSRVWCAIIGGAFKSESDFDLILCMLINRRESWRNKPANDSIADGGGRVEPESRGLDWTP